MVPGEKRRAMKGRSMAIDQQDRLCADGRKKSTYVVERNGRSIRRSEEVDRLRRLDYDVWMPKGLTKGSAAACRWTRVVKEGPAECRWKGTNREDSVQGMDDQWRSINTYNVLSIWRLEIVAKSTNKGEERVCRVRRVSPVKEEESVGRIKRLMTGTTCVVDWSVPP